MGERIWAGSSKEGWVARTVSKPEVRFFLGGKKMTLREAVPVCRPNMQLSPFEPDGRNSGWFLSRQRHDGRAGRGWRKTMAGPMKEEVSLSSPVSVVTGIGAYTGRPVPRSGRPPRSRPRVILFLGVAMALPFRRLLWSLIALMVAPLAACGGDPGPKPDSAGSSQSETATAQASFTPTQVTSGTPSASGSLSEQGGEQEYSTNPLVPLDTVRRVCHAVTAASMSAATGMQLIYRAQGSGDTNINAMDSTIGVRCSYVTKDQRQELSVIVFMTPFPASTIKKDLRAGIPAYKAKPGIGDEAYLEGAEQQINSVLFRRGPTWYQLDMVETDGQLIGESGTLHPEGSLDQYSRIAAAVIAADVHP